MNDAHEAHRTGARLQTAAIARDGDVAGRAPHRVGAGPDGDAPTLVEFWETRYQGVDRVWSGRVNAVLADTAVTLEPGSALDLGCGEGGDAVWLAQHGWRVTGVDVSPTAVARAAQAASALGLHPESLRFEASDLATWQAPEVYDLVTASFLHSWPVLIPRTEILRRAASYVAPGGHLLVTSHAAPPPWADTSHAHEHIFPTPEADLADLALDADPAGGTWQVVACEVRERGTTGPDGAPATLADSVVLVRRRH